MRLVTTLGLLLLAACSPRVDLGNGDAPDAATPPDATMSADAGEPGQDASLCPGFEGETLEVQPRLWSWDPVSGAKSWECSLALIGFPAAGRSDVFAFTNHGTAPLTFSNLRIQQDPTKDEAFSLEGPAEFTLAPCASVMVWVRFAPATRDRYVGRLEYSSNDPSRPSGRCVLTGQGVGPNITVEPTELDFGVVEVGQFQRRRVIISNTGMDMAGTTDDNLKLMQPEPTSRCSKNTDCVVANTCIRGACWDEAFPVMESAGDFAVDNGVVGYTPVGIPAGQSADLVVRFAPLSAGPKSGRLTIYSNDPAKPAVVVELVGTGGP